MPIRDRKSIKLGPGVRLNLGTKSAGVSFALSESEVPRTRASRPTRCRRRSST
jgi:hypothetical protein